MRAAACSVRTCTWSLGASWSSGNNSLCRLTMATELVSASGQRQRAAETFRTDGTESPGTLTPCVFLVARWVGSHVLASIAKKDDQVIALVTYEVSGLIPANR